MGINLLLVDALNLIRRIYAALPGEDGPGRVEDALKASVQSLQRALRDCVPTHALCVFDGEGPGWRHKMYAAYKAGRSPMPEDLRQRLFSFKDGFTGIGVPSLRLPALEADDVIATLAHKVALRNGDVTILSTDKVFLQLLSDKIRVRDHFLKQYLDEKHVMEKFGVDSGRFVDFLALSGDSTNNIKGISGIGRKTAAGLLKAHGSLDNVLDNADSMKGTIGEKLKTNAEQAQLAQALVCLQHDIDLGVNLRSFRYHASLET